MDELGDPPSPSNDVTDEGERRALAGLGRLLLIEALTRSLSGRPYVAPSPAPPPEEQERLRALALAAIDAAIDADDARSARIDAPIGNGLSPGWRDRVLRAIEEMEERGPTSRERPRCSPWETP